MKLRITRTCILSAGITAVVGQVFEDFPDSDGKALIEQGKAEEWEPLCRPMPMPEMEVREPDPQHRDPERQRTQKRSKRRRP